jgi:RNA polymerase sigma-32 factor
MTTTALAIPTPASASSLESYIHAVQSFPMLSVEEERDLATRFHQRDDVEAARMLVLSHLRLVVNIARGYLGYGLPHADLIQEGNIGLMKAVRRFDPERGVRLVSFAVHWIRAEIHDFILRNWRMVKVATTKAQRKLFFNLRSLKPGSDTLSPSEVASIAQQLNVKEADVVEMEMRLGGQDIALEGYSDSDEDSFGPIDYLADPHDEPSVVLESSESGMLRERGLEKALHKLDPRSRRIVEARWLTEDAGATLHDLAAEFGVSAERIRQIEQKALQQMKSVIREEIGD